MNIPLIFSLIAFSSALTTNDELKPFAIYLEEMFEQLAKEKCVSECHEKKGGCKEYLNYFSLCTDLNKEVYKDNYNVGVIECEKSFPLESLLACSYDSLRSTYEMEDISLPDNFFNEFIDSLTVSEDR